jgi:hypothetical protein
MASDGGASARTAAWRPAWTRASGGRVEAGGAGGRRHRRRRRAADSDAIQSGGGDSAKTEVVRLLYRAYIRRFSLSLSV